MKTKFKDIQPGTRFRYPGKKIIWIKRDQETIAMIKGSLCHGMARLREPGRIVEVVK